MDASAIAEMKAKEPSPEAVWNAVAAEAKKTKKKSSKKSSKSKAEKNKAAAEEGEVEYTAAEWAAWEAEENAWWGCEDWTVPTVTVVNEPLTPEEAEKKAKNKAKKKAAASKRAAEQEQWTYDSYYTKPQGKGDWQTGEWQQPQKGKGKGKGVSKGKGKNGQPDEMEMTHCVIRDASGNIVKRIPFEGKWLDSLNNEVYVSRRYVGNYKIELDAELKPIDKKNAASKWLSCRRFESMEAQSVSDAPQYMTHIITKTIWRCGNAHLEFSMSDESQLVWVTADGRHSVWKRRDSNSKTQGSFPWLLCDKGVLPQETLERILLKATPLQKAQAEDGGRISVLLDMRQAISSQHKVQETFRYLLMDHDIERAEDEDYIVPKPTSPLWDRLEDAGMKKICTDLSERFYNSEYPPTPIMFIAGGQGGKDEIFVGRHMVPCSPEDIKRLRKRFIVTADKKWSAKEKTAIVDSHIAHVLTLYSIFENPLAAHETRRSNLQMGLDPRLRMMYGYEIFASPFNAETQNGKYLSKFPHVERHFGSLGKYPENMDLIPEKSAIYMNPPYLENIFNEKKMNELKEKYQVRFVVPVRDGPYRDFLNKSGYSAKSVWVRRFWDASAQEFREVVNPVLYWEDESLKGSLENATVPEKLTIDTTTPHYPHGDLCESEIFANYYIALREAADNKAREEAEKKAKVRAEEEEEFRQLNGGKMSFAAMARKQTEVASKADPTPSEVASRSTLVGKIMAAPKPENAEIVEEIIAPKPVVVVEQKDVSVSEENSYAKKAAAAAAVSSTAAAVVSSEKKELEQPASTTISTEEKKEPSCTDSSLEKKTVSKVTKNKKMHLDELMAELGTQKRDQGSNTKGKGKGKGKASSSSAATSSSAETAAPAAAPKSTDCNAFPSLPLTKTPCKRTSMTAEAPMTAQKEPKWGAKCDSDEK